MPKTVGTRGERRRLALNELDWNLTGRKNSNTVLTRTRGGGHGRPDIASTVARNAITIGEVLEEGKEEPAADELSPSSSDELEEDVTEPKPTHSRVIVEVAMLEQAFDEYPCKVCGENLELKIQTCCIASSIELVCNKVDCPYVCEFKKPTETKIHELDDRKYERMTDYALNVLYVLGMISVGDSHTEAGRLLGLLSLPNDTTMSKRSFSIIEDRIGPYLRELCDEIIVDNLDEEARLSMDETDYNLWKMWTKDEEGLGAVPAERMPKLSATYDMAWQQRSSGHQYNSVSGHGSLFGAKTRKLIYLVVKCKVCNVCKMFETKHPGEDVPDHQCWKTHDGSSKSMETSAALSALVDLFDNKKVVIKRLCCDDDSSIRAILQWSNADYCKNYNTDIIPQVPITRGDNKGKLQPRKDNGKLPGNVPEPTFVADPNHRRKTLNGELINMDTATKGVKETMTRMDTIRIVKNFGYMIRTLRDKDPSEYVNAGKAVLEHHFDNHEYCGAWCKRQHESEQQRKATLKYYRCKTKDAKLYAALKEKLARFIDYERLDEMAHTLDTNMNEAFNQICTWFAPKNKVFAGSGSLHNRLAFAVGINSLGFEVFFQRLFKKMGIPMADNVANYLHHKELTRMKRLTKIKTRESKIHKSKRKREILKEQTRIAKIERHKREGTYKPGMAVFDDPDIEQPDRLVLLGQHPARKKARNGGKPAKKYCEYCGAGTHSTRKSQKCQARDATVKMYRWEDGSPLSGPPYPRTAPAAGGQDVADEIAAADCDAMDHLPWDTAAPDLNALLAEDVDSDADSVTSGVI
jgi:hypothetical protein